MKGDKDGRSSKGVEVSTVRERTKIPCEGGIVFRGSGLNLLNYGNNSRCHEQRTWPGAKLLAPDGDCNLDMGFVVMADGICRRQGIEAMAKLDEYFAKHVGFAIGLHFVSGLGLAWLVSLAWHYSLISLVLGIVFCLAGITGHFYARFAKQ